VFELDPEMASLTVVEKMPGVSSEQIVAATGFAVRFAEDCREVLRPNAEMLRILREEIDPLGLRRLEFVASRDRGTLLDEIIAGDRELVARLAAAAGKVGRTANKGRVR
jgi:glutaconate CoA-transferase subunit A